MIDSDFADLYKNFVLIYIFLCKLTLNVLPAYVTAAFAESQPAAHFSSLPSTTHSSCHTAPVLRTVHGARFSHAHPPAKVSACSCAHDLDHHVHIFWVLLVPLIHKMFTLKVRNVMRSWIWVLRLSGIVHYFQANLTTKIIYNS